MKPATQDQPYHDGTGPATETVPGYTAVPNAVMDDIRLTTRDLTVYIALCHYAAAGEWPSVALIGRTARCSKNSTLRALRRLVGFGYIEIRREVGFTNLYTVHQVPR